MLLYVALVAAALWLGLRAYRSAPGLQRGRWRVGSGLLALVLLLGAAAVLVRAEWLPGAGLAAAAAVLALLSRSRRVTRPFEAQPPVEDISLTQARSILGVGPDTDAAGVRAAYTRLMRMAHPDKGGTAGLAAQLNAARDRLLKG